MQQSQNFAATSSNNSTSNEKDSLQNLLKNFFDIPRMMKIATLFTTIISENSSLIEKITTAIQVIHEIWSDFAKSVHE